MAISGYKFLFWKLHPGYEALLPKDKNLWRPIVQQKELMTDFYFSLPPH